MPFSATEIHRTVYDFCPDAVVVADAERRIMAVNPAFEEQFGYSLEEVKGKLTRILYACAEDFEKQSKRRYIAPPLSIENRYLTRYRRKDGSVFTSETTGKAVYGDDGTRHGYVALIRDISSRVRVKDLLGSVIVLASDVNAQTDVVVQNLLQAGLDYYGLESAMVTCMQQDHLTIRNVIDSTGNFHVAEERELEATFCGTVIEADDVRSYHHAGMQEIAMSRCYKEQRFEAYIGVPLHVRGKLSGTLSFFGYTQRPAPFTQEDKTLIQFLADWLTGFLEQRKQKVELERLTGELAKAAERAEYLYRATPAMLHSINASHHLVEVSDYWLEKMGYADRSEVIGRPITDFTVEEMRSSRTEAIRKFWKAGEPVRGHFYEFIRKDGSRFEIELSAIIANPGSESGEQSLAVVFDVTERNRAKRELEKKNNELERLNDELETFASVASHDLQEPLRKIRKFSEIAREEFSGTTSNDGAYALKVMHDAASRMQTLVTDILTYSRTANTAMETQPVDLGAIVAQVLVDLSVQIDEADADISYQALPVVNGDPVQIRQMFQNLIENAVRYRHEARRPKIDITAEDGENGSDMLIRVSDNGIGFDQSLAEQIYLPFRRLNSRSQRGGSGLGLTICARIAERHGWNLITRSRSGKGSSFTLVIPADDIHSQ